ncbi:homeobox domain-containing protein [Tubulinosema ratisbonensis]|uniref:Homeobox domain-containing protein n=1 Tax=Tubulinosema ratisbonensis TaxID=291195 RepID=A0A437AIF6_9MICR|nr:homeobox domain-containing protein [Tubulinosema ratisbonensis]
MPDLQIINKVTEEKLHKLKKHKPFMHNFTLTEPVADAIIGLLLAKKEGEKRSEILRAEKTAKEIAVLEEIFNLSNYPDSTTKKTLSVLLNMQQKTIQIWFQNRRRYIKSTFKNAKKKTILTRKDNFDERIIAKKDCYSSIYRTGKSFVQTSLPTSLILSIYFKIYNIPQNQHKYD